MTAPLLPKTTALFFDETLGGLDENLALDELLLQQADAGKHGNVLRIWEWPHSAVVLGRSNRIATEIQTAACKAAGIPIHRRCSGGGTVLLGEGCLCYSVILCWDEELPIVHLKSITAQIMERMAQAVSTVLPAGSEVAVRGTSDLTLNDRKFSGNSQRWLRRSILHHGTLLYGFSIESIARFLAFPSRQPDYRADRGHGEFVCNIEATFNDLATAIRAAWNAEAAHAEIDAVQLRQLVARYESRDWVYRI